MASEPFVLLRALPSIVMAFALWPTAAEAQLRPGDILTAVRTRTTNVRRCYEQALRTEPGLSGRIFLDVRIEASGRVRKARVIRSTMQNRWLERCVVRVFSRLRFAPSQAPTSFRYPLIFRPPD